MPDLPSLPSSLLQSPPASAEADYDRELRELVANLRQMSLNKTVREPSARENNILDTLDASQQSVVYLFVLLAHYQAFQTANKHYFPDFLRPGGDIWSKSLAFLQVFDPVQIRYAGQEWVKLVELVAGAAEAASRPLMAVLPIRRALLRLEPSCSVLTTTHTLLMRLCLRARMYAAALPVLDRTIHDVPARSVESHFKKSNLTLCRPRLPSAAYITPLSGLSGKLNYRNYLEYFLYGGMVYMGLKKWENALHCLQVVISAPTTNSVSMIMVQAYKKWVLACLLSKGTVLPMPKSTNPLAAKLYKSLGRAYDGLADVFSAGSFSRLRAEVSAGETVWDADNNSGLVFQTMEAYQKFSILALEKTFAALMVNDVPRTTFATVTGNQDLETFIAWLIGGDMLRASLAQPREMAAATVLRFTTDLATRNLSSEIAAWSCLAAQKDRIRPLMDRMRETDIRFELAQEYVENIRRKRRQKEDGNRDRGALTKNGEDDFDLDEDIMAGMPT